MITDNIARRLLVVGAAACWVTTVTISLLILNRIIDQDSHPGVGLVSVLASNVAITLTVVWSQFYVRHMLQEGFRAGIYAQRAYEEERRERDNAARDRDEAARDRDEAARNRDDRRAVLEEPWQRKG